MFEIMPLVITVAVFASATIIVFIVGRFLSNQATIQRRLSVSVSGSEGSGASESAASNTFFSSVTRKFDEKKFGIEGPIRSKLRRDLIRAGYFSDQAINGYIFARLVVVVLIPVISYIVVRVFFADVGFGITMAIVAFSAFLAVLGPDAYISRRQRAMQHEYRLLFPDLLDMLVVCVDAGLALDAAIARIQPEVTKQSAALGTNLIILGAETRAGRSTAEALSTFADRLNLDEARAFVILLRQSLELGTDVSDALRVFSDEMRQKRLLRAEETANKLPVKMVMPLGGLIFPVILVTVMYPIIIRLLAVMHQTGR